MVIKFHDRRPVTLCSTIHKGCMMDTGKKTRDTQEPILKPDVVLDYNKHMGNVDRSDQFVQYLAMRRRTLKWYKKVLFHMMDLCTVQAYIIYKMVTNKPVLHRVFKTRACQGDLGFYRVTKSNIFWTSSCRCTRESPKAQQ